MISVTELIPQFQIPIDWVKRAKDKAKKNGVTIEQIQEEYEAAKDRGKRIHDKMIEREASKTKDVEIGNEKPTGGEALNNPLDNILQNNFLYLEKRMFSSSYGIIIRPDKLEVRKGTINITDYKTWKTIYRNSSIATNTGIKLQPKKMLAPLEHLDDCNYIEACLQLSLYMYVAWANNKHLKPGKLFIRHLTVNDNEKITKDDLIEVPYMREEVQIILKYLKLNES